MNRINQYHIVHINPRVQGGPVIRRYRVRQIHLWVFIFPLLLLLIVDIEDDPGCVDEDEHEHANADRQRLQYTEAVGLGCWFSADNLASMEWYGFHIWSKILLLKYCLNIVGVS